jgi:hypothetical protein
VLPIEQLALNVIGVPLQILMTPPTIGGEVVKQRENAEGGLRIIFDVQESRLPPG